MARAKSTPGLDAAAPFVLVESLNADPGINAEVSAVAPSVLEVPMELPNVRFHLAREMDADTYTDR